MSYSTPPQITPGEFVDEDDWNLLVDDITFLANPPACRVYNSANISHTTSGTAQVVTFNSERYDTDSMHSTSVSTGRITFNTAGLYVVSATLEFAANATGYRQLELLLNGATFIAIDNRPSVGAGTSTYCTIQTVYKFAAADYVELRANQTSGGALNMNNFSKSSPEFMATWIGLG